MMKTEQWMPALYLLGLATGLLIGWAVWRVPMLFAIARGSELDADGLTICSKKIAEAGRAALLPDNDQGEAPLLAP